MRSSNVKKVLKFTDFSKKESENKLVIEGLISQILRNRQSKLDSDYIIEMAKKESTEINSLMRNPEIKNECNSTNKINQASPQRKRLVFANLESVTILQDKVIESLYQYVQDNDKEWSDIKLNIINYILGTIPEGVITLSIIQTSGDCVKVKISSHTSLFSLFQIAYTNRHASMKEASFNNYHESLEFGFKGMMLKLNNTEGSVKLSEGCTLAEIGKDFTASADFDWNKMTLIDPITLEPCTKPYILKPGCSHAFEQDSLTKWIQTKLDKQQQPDCPCCRDLICKSNLVKLSMWKQQLNQEQGQGHSLDNRYLSH